MSQNAEVLGEATDTPSAILAGAAEQLPDVPFDEISYKDLGRAVGVSERTVYRHYPTRSHLLAALALWLEARSFSPTAFSTWPQFFTAVEERFTRFDKAPTEALLLARAASLPPLGQQHTGSFFSDSVNALVDDSAPGLNLRDRRRTSAALCYMASAQYWARCRTGFGMTADEIYSGFMRTAREILAAAPTGTWPQISLTEAP